MAFAAAVIDRANKAANQIQGGLAEIRDSSKLTSQAASGASKSLVPDRIGRSLLEHDYLTLSLYRKKDVIRHTGIALKLDGTPKFTIDYGKDEGEKAEEGKGIPPKAEKVKEVKSDGAKAGSTTGSSFSKSSRKVSEISSSPFNQASGIGADLWDAEIMTVLCDLTTISLNNKEREVLKLIDGLIKLDIGKYNVFTNNCRDWCLEAGDFIKRKCHVSEENMQKFKSWIASIRETDARRALPIAVHAVKSASEKAPGCKKDNAL